MSGFKKGICKLALIPVRSEPSERSEQTTQILFGETFTIKEVKENWSFVETDFDNYQGWITTKMFSAIPETTVFPALNLILKEPIGKISFLKGSKKSQYIPGGSSFTELNNEFIVQADSFKFNSICELFKPGSEPELTETALLYLGAPYLWGGRTVFGIDCSGFSQVVFKMNGIALKRDAYQQAEQGTSINFIDESLPGDLAFFDNADGKIIHVGMILPNNKIIHASGEVRIDKLDHQGIFDEQLRKYTHKLRLIKRNHNTKY